MASVTKQTIEAAWRKRFEGGERTVKVVQVPGLDRIIYDDYAIWRLDYKLPGVNPETGKRWAGKKGMLGRLAPELPPSGGDRACAGMEGQGRQGH